MLLYQLPLGIDSENPVQRNTNLLIGIHILKSHKQSASQPKARTLYILARLKHEQSTVLQCIPVVKREYARLQKSHRSSVAKSSVERFSVWVEQVLYICETLDLKLLWFLLNHLPAQHDMTSNTYYKSTGKDINMNTSAERCERNKSPKIPKIIVRIFAYDK